jgi:hypothetical protein
MMLSFSLKMSQVMCIEMKLFIGNNKLIYNDFIRVMPILNSFILLLLLEKKTNLISSLNINGVEFRDPEVIKIHVLHYQK